jgi:CheY-like chemotaxis protein
MGGDIHVFSTSGEGSRFVVTLELPVARESSPPPEPDTDTAVIARVQESVPAPRETKTDLLIALVDDNPTGRAVGRAFLARLGYGADVHESGMSLLEAVTSGSRPDLVFMDIRMPVMDGFEATRRLLEYYVSNGIRPPVVAALSADAIPEVRQRCLREGMDFFLSKPTQLSDLKRVIGEVASRRSGSVPSR